MKQKIQTAFGHASGTIRSPRFTHYAKRVAYVTLGAWSAMLVLGVEVLTSTEYNEAYDWTVSFRTHYSDASYTCTYWTGTGFRHVSKPPEGFTPCPVWRWGRQHA